VFTRLEAREVVVATHERQVSDCLDGLGRCDHSELTAAEARAVARAERERNGSSCTFGWDGCDRSRLNARETAGVEAAVRIRNASRILRSRAADAGRSRPDSGRRPLALRPIALVPSG